VPNVKIRAGHGLLNCGRDGNRGGHVASHKRIKTVTLEGLDGVFFPRFSVVGLLRGVRAGSLSAPVPSNDVGLGARWCWGERRSWSGARSAPAMNVSVFDPWRPPGFCGHTPTCSRSTPGARYGPPPMPAGPQRHACRWWHGTPLARSTRRGVLVSAYRWGVDQKQNNCGLARLRRHQGDSPAEFCHRRAVVLGNAIRSSIDAKSFGRDHVGTRDFLTTGAAANNIIFDKNQRRHQVVADRHGRRQGRGNGVTMIRKSYGRSHTGARPTTIDIAWTMRRGGNGCRPLRRRAGASDSRDRL